MKLDFHTAVQAALVICVIFILISGWLGLRTIQRANKLKFFRMRRDRIVAGWRMILFAFILVLVALALNFLAEPIIYMIIPPTLTLTPSPTASLTPTITETPTITLTPTITSTPSQTDTPTATVTPHVPLVVEVQFTSIVTPNPEAIFSPLTFARKLDKDFQPVDPATVFQNPVGHLYAAFSYDKMKVDSEWTVVWYRGSELVHFETKPWDGNVGGWGYADWDAEAWEWQPGDYEVQVFVGLDWKITGFFTVEGEAPTPPPTRTPTLTITPSPTIGPSPTPTITLTRTPHPPTDTPRPANTHAPTSTPSPTRPTATRAPTDTEVSKP